MLTLFYAGALTLIAIFLAFKTIQQRLGTGILLGTGESFELLQANRAHGNLIENAVLFLILIGLMEVSGQFSNLTIGILGDILSSLGFLMLMECFNQNLQVTLELQGLLLLCLFFLYKLSWHCGFQVLG